MSVIAHNGKVVVSDGKALSFDNLIALANTTTGETDTTLTEAVQRLIDGFGGGGGGADAVIKATYDNYGRNPVATLVAGSFNDLATKLSSFSPVNVQLVCETRDEDMGESSCLNVPCRVIAKGDFSDITNVSFISIEPFMDNIAVCVPITTITFNSDNTLQVFTN